MRPSFPNSATVRAPEALLQRGASWRPVTVGVRYGYLRHATHGPVLIDTGYGPRATQGSNRSAALKAYGAMLRPRLAPEGQPAAVLGRDALSMVDVRLVVVTHFHPDHIAALRDLPNARFIASRIAWDRVRRMGSLARLRHAVFLELFPDDFDDRLIDVDTLALRPAPFGLGAGHDLFGDGSTLAVPLPGHAIGHFGVVWPHLSPPLLHAVDTSWLAHAVLDDRLPRGPARLIYSDEQAMMESARKVRTFARAGGEVVTCHDRVVSP